MQRCDAVSIFLQHNAVSVESLRNGRISIALHTGLVGSTIRFQRTDVLVSIRIDLDRQQSEQDRFFYSPLSGFVSTHVFLADAIHPHVLGFVTSSDALCS